MIIKITVTMFNNLHRLANNWSSTCRRREMKAEVYPAATAVLLTPPIVLTISIKSARLTGS